MPSLNINPSEYNTLKSLTQIFSIISVISAAIVVIYNVSVKARRKFPSRMTTYYSLCSCLFCLNIALGSIDEYAILTPDNSKWCKLQGFLFCSGAICGAIMTTLNVITGYIFK